MLNKIEEYIKKYKMISKEDTVIAGVSGGADSMCLLFVLDELRKKMGFRLIVVHVNHCLRGEAADADENYVVEECRKRDLVCEVFREDMRKYAEENKFSEEEAGRENRRRAYEKTMEKYQGTKIALAHHQEDNAETFFLHLARGSKLKGLGGIYPVKGRYIRPLLVVSREEIEQFLEERGISYCTDLTNFDDVYARNKVRLHVLPYLKKEINPRTVEHINSTMEHLRQVEAYLEIKTEEALKSCSILEDEKAVIDEKAFAGIEELIQGRVVRNLLVQVSGKEKDLEEVHVEEVISLFKKQNGRRIDLPYKMTAEKIYGGIEICRGKKQVEMAETEWKIEASMGKTSLYQWKDVEISCRLFKKGQDMPAPPKKTFTKWFDYDIINKNVIARTRRAGDRLVIDDKGNSQKLKSFFINEKVPVAKRDSILLFADGEQILWVTGYRQSKAYQVTKDTINILEISINGGKGYGTQN